LETLLQRITATLEQLHDRLARLEAKVDGWENAKPESGLESDSPISRLNQLEEEVNRLEKLASAHLDPTEKSPYLSYLVKLGGLQPSDALLDVGCGPGRIAKELSRYLAADGTYYGLEIQARFVERLRQQYVERPNFHFYHADIRNTDYNPRGMISPTAYKFPLPDGCVQLVVLRSVFTHMLPAEMENYMSEIFRVLSPHGRSVITYYLLNEQSRPFVDAAPRPIFSAFPFDGRGSFPFDRGTHRVRYAEVPERAVAYDEEFVRSLYDRCAMKILEPINYGSWSGRIRYLTGQDLIVAEKVG
jgi:SAM-dependent methyltransferase